MNSTEPRDGPPRHPPARNATQAFFDHNSAPRTNSSATIAAALKKQYPTLQLTIINAALVSLFGFASDTGEATVTPLKDDGHSLPSSLEQTVYIPPARRSEGSAGIIATQRSFGKFLYQWRNQDFIIYVADIFDAPFNAGTMHFILSSNESYANALIRTAGQWATQLSGQIMVFDGGWWSRSAELYESVMKASWDTVILDAEMKKSFIDDHMSFFRSESTYKRLRVPWKRGIIVFGPPGNGKTISIKAMMHSLYKESPEVPTLYVRSLKSFFGPEDSIKQIFAEARRFAPCYLVFEDLDSLVTDEIRSYFLNEVDGLQTNDGIFMIGSTNHLERLDPGISKRPSRFDRKYLFPNPDEKERVAYCKFWQQKLKDNKDIEFPDRLCDAVAGITDKFSFAYIQEAFVAALLAIARADGPDDELQLRMNILTVDLRDDWVGVIGSSGDDDKDLNDLVLWVEIKKQIAILREGIEDEPEE